eukprot:GHVR01006523.1.p1 GENE.GHVR01006523.1~~GHVR01006523.1.p1  ORF type:complete len:100 (+),score=87.47 GHVR01006523.1:175-474(+)
MPHTHTHTQGDTPLKYVICCRVVLGRCTACDVMCGSDDTHTHTESNTHTHTHTDYMPPPLLKNNLLEQDKRTPVASCFYGESSSTSENTVDTHTHTHTH